MKQTLLREKYPIFTLEIDRGETDFQSVDEIIDYLKGRIEEHHLAQFIAVFDHYAHTRSLQDGQLGEGILAAKNVIFCCGLTLPEPSALALRPRSIGVAETDSGFVLTFMEAPMPVVNIAMEEWAKSLRTRKAA